MRISDYYGGLLILPDTNEESKALLEIKEILITKLGFPRDREFHKSDRDAISN